MPRLPEALRSVPLAAYALAAAVAVPSLDGAGFTPASQTLLIVLSGVTLLAAALADSSVVAIARRSPLVRVLVLLGLLSILSAAWTVSSTRDAARWGLVILAYGALAMSTARLAKRTGATPIAAGLALLAAIEAVLGLRAALLHALPDAEWFNGSWRPGGSFQYPPALALLEVAALPALLSGLGRGRAVASLSAAAAVMAGATLGSADSRLELGLAALVLGIAVLRTPRGARRRAEMGAAVALIAVAGVVGHLIVGRQVAATQSGAGTLQLVLVTLLGAVLAAEWLPIRALVRGPGRPSGRAAVLVALTAAVVAGAATISTAGTGQIHQPYSLSMSASARIHLWKAALETWSDRPLLGAGAGAYYAASAGHQGAKPSLFAHNLPLELAAELGVPGLLVGIALYAAGIDLLRRARSTRELWLFGPAVGAFLIANLLDWPWHLAGLGAAWATAAGALIAAVG